MFSKGRALLREREREVKTSPPICGNVRA